MERTATEAAIEFLERWAVGQIVESSQQKMRIKEAAQYLHVTEDMLRNWDRNGLITIARDSSNGYCLYGIAEFGRIRVIRALVQSGYSLMATLQMLRHFDAGYAENLRTSLEIPREERDAKLSTWLQITGIQACWRWN